MGLPAEQLVDAFRRLPKSEASTEDLSPAGADFWKLAEKVERTLASELEGWETVEASAARLEEAARAAIANNEATDLEPMFEFIEQQEREIKAEYAPRLRQAKKHFSETLRLPPEARPRLMPVFKKQIAGYRRILQGIADLKLRFLALRALGEPPGDADIFSDAKSLRRYLDSL